MRATNWLRVGLCLTLSACTHIPIFDGSMSSLKANDTTAIIEINGPGCLADPHVGWAYCRKEVGQVTNRDTITFSGPKSNCNRDYCVDIQVLYPTGEPALSLSIPKDQTFIQTTWAELTKRDTFQKDDRGWWLVFIRYYWLDATGTEQETVQEGEIRLRVLAKGYVPLYNAPSNSAYAYTVDRGGHVYKWTTAGRAYAK